MNILNYNMEMEDRITKELYALILSYLSKDKKIDNVFLKHILSIVNEKKKLSNYITDININNDLYCKGTYDNLNLDININVEQFMKELAETEDKYTKEENKIRKYIIITQAALHEIEHGNQEKIKETEDSLESKILIASSRKRDVLLNDIKINSINLKKYLKLCYFRSRYHKYYDCCPYERLAYLKSCKKSLELSQMFNSKKMIDIVSFNMICNYIEGYDRSVEPTIYYTKKINKGYNDYFYLKEVSEKLNLEDRKILGLKLNKQELKNMIKEFEYGIKKVDYLLK